MRVLGRVKRTKRCVSSRPGTRRWDSYEWTALSNTYSKTQMFGININALNIREMADVMLVLSAWYNYN